MDPIESWSIQSDLTAHRRTNFQKKDLVFPLRENCDYCRIAPRQALASCANLNRTFASSSRVADLLERNRAIWKAACTWFTQRSSESNRKGTEFYPQ